MHWITKKCLHCGKEFSTPYKKREQKYCSNSCSSKANHIKKQTKGDTLKCVYCGKEFVVSNAQKNSKYCSVHCRNKAYYEQAKAKEKCVCKCCGKIYQRTQAWQSHNRCPSCGGITEKYQSKFSEAIYKNSPKPKLKPTKFEPIIQCANTIDEFSRQFINKVVKI